MRQESAFESELLHAKAGDEPAFGGLIDRFATRLLVLLRREAGRALGADCAVEDLWQTVVHRAWSLLPELERADPGGFYRWLVAICHNVIGDRVRYVSAKGRRTARHVGSALGNAGARALADDATSVASGAAHREDALRLNEALETLEPGVRRLVVRHVVEGASLSELAAESGVARSTVWGRVAEALETLRHRLGRAGGDVLE